MKYKYIILISLYLLHTSCEDFVSVEVPDYKIISETVFSNDITANSAVVGIYNELFKADFSNGNFRSVTMLAGLSGDNLRTTALNYAMIEFGENEILNTNSYNLDLWSSAYKIIYMCNAVLDGLQMSEGVTTKMKDKLMAEARFVRAFVYFYLVNLYGDVPLIQTTDYRVNALASRNTTPEVYELIIDDLKSAVAVLDINFDNGERLRANKFTAMALLARTYLFVEDWENAETFSNQVIDSSDNYTLLENLNEVFLVNSKESIWQLSPAGRGALSFITNEARIFILTSPPPNSQQPVALSSEIIESYDNEDLRLKHWIGKFDTENQAFYYPFKYKNNSQGIITEYNMVMRLAEQYLIRAEARAQLGKLTESIVDLDKIRKRANLQLISDSAPDIGKEALLDSISKERNRELFSEWGHRWLDLKRTGIATEVLSNKKSSWQDTDLLYPIPEDEINKNPNLTQNNGY
ncbi:RagB/SusD family nutrient uptake outer membrane protein [Gelidibacter salicanalis]|nr:RagB/SusD family nutrient uptake outer membrane protein [Gelidibacter salicanalis]